MQLCFHELRDRETIVCAFVSVDLQGATKLRQSFPEAQGSVVSAMLGAYHECARTCMGESGLCEIKWDGDGGRFAAYGDEHFVERAVRGCQALLNEWYAFTRDAQRNPTKRGLTLRMAVDCGTLIWHGDPDNLDSFAISQAEKLQQALRSVPGAVKFGITDHTFQQLPQDLRDLFRAEPSLGLHSNDGVVHVASQVVRYALPLVSPKFSRAFATRAYVVGHPIHTHLIVDYAQGEQQLEVEWSRLGTSKKPTSTSRSWHKVPGGISPRKAGALFELPPFHGARSGPYAVPGIAVRYRTDAAAPWVTEVVDPQTIPLEAPKPASVVATLEVRPRLPTARSDVEVILRLNNSGNLTAMVQGKVRWVFRPVANVQFQPFSGESSFTDVVEGYATRNLLLQTLDPSLPCLLDIAVNDFVVSGGGRSALMSPSQRVQYEIHFNWDAPCLGRADIVARLKTFGHYACEAQRGKMVIVQGPIGSGKSTLVTAAIDALSRLVSFATFRFAFENNLSEPHKWARAFLAWLRSDAIVDLYRECGLDTSLLLTKYREMLDFFVHRFQIAHRDERNHAFLSFVDLLRELSSALPLVVVIEDLQNLDTGTLKLLEVLSRSLAKLPLIVYGTALIEKSNQPLQSFLDVASQSDWGVIESCGLLSPEGIRDWLSYLFDSSGLRPNFYLEAHAATDGHPVRFRRWIEQLYQQGIIRYRLRSGWEIDLGQQVQHAAGEGIDDILLVPIKRLPPDAATVIQHAAVIGRIVDRQTLQAICPFDETQLLDITDMLVDRQILRDTASTMPVKSSGIDLWPDDALMFAHSQQQDAIYRLMITQARKKTIHAHIAEYLERRKDAPEFRIAQLAYHWPRSGQMQRALPYMLADADDQLNAGATAEAYRECMLAYRWCMEHRSQANDLAAALAAHRLARISQQAQKAEASDFITMAEDLITRGDSPATSGTHKGGDVSHDVLFSTLAEIGHPFPSTEALYCDIMLERGRQDQLASLWLEAKKRFEASWAVADISGDTPRQVHAIRNLGILAIDQGNLNQSVDFFKSALERVPDTTSPQRADVLQHLGRAQVMMGRWSDAQDTLEQALRMTTSKRLLARIHNTMGEMLRLRGKWIQAAQELTLARSLALEVGDRFTASFTTSNHAKLAYLVGDCATAVKLANRYIEQCQEADYSYGRATALLWRSLAWHSLGQPQRAHDGFEDARNVFREHDMLYGLALADLFEATCLVPDQADVALSRIATAEHKFETIGDAYHVSVCRLKHLELELAQAHERARNPSQMRKLRQDLFGVVLAARSTFAEYHGLLAQVELLRVKYLRPAAPAAASASDAPKMLHWARYALNYALSYNRNCFDTIYRALAVEWRALGLSLTPLSECANAVLHEAGSPPNITAAELDIHRL